MQLGLYFQYLLLTSYHLTLTSIAESYHYRTLLRPSACAFRILAAKESIIFQLKYTYLETAIFRKMIHFTKSNITSAILKLQTSTRYQIKAKCQGFPQSLSNPIVHPLLLYFRVNGSQNRVGQNRFTIETYDKDYFV